MYQIIYLRASKNDVSSINRVKSQIREMGETEGISLLGLYESFYSMPQKEAENAFVLLLEIKDANAQHSKLYQILWDAGMTVLSDFKMEPEEGSNQDWIKLLGESGTIEFAAREIKTSEEKFLDRREKFLSNIIKKDGFAFRQEFKQVESNVRILLFGWKTEKHFQKAGKEVLRSPSTLFHLIRYFMLIKQKAFQVGRPVK